MDKGVSYELLKGTVENVVYYNEGNDYSVFEISDDQGALITCVGNITSVHEGESVSLTGSWVNHKDFGKQFSFVSYEKSLPKEIDGIIQFLSSRTVKGIGPVTALKIVNKYGTDTFDVIEHHPEWLADIPGITMKKAAAICESFKEHSELCNVMMFFKDHLTVNETHKVYKLLGSSAISSVRQNPYILCEGDASIPFEHADKLAASFGIAKDNDERILHGIIYVLKYNASVNGHTCLPKEKIIPAAASLLGLDVRIVAERFDRYLESGDIVEYSDGDDVFVMTEQTASDEEYLAKRLIEVARGIPRLTMENIGSLLEASERGMGLTFARHQKEALFRCLDGGVTIITGGPGTGKTTVIKALIALFNNLGMKTVLSAPTGRAAKRMSEATSREAKTVHRMLEMEKDDKDRYVYNRNSRNTLDEDVVIVDEASMLDLSLTAALVRALRRGSRLVLIGDADQLPSVGSGNVLADLIASKAFNTVCLTEIFRQSCESLIVTNAHSINSGKPPILNVTDNDFFFVRRENERDIASTVASLITERLPKTYGESIKSGIQVITPSKKGAGGVEVLNQVLQEKLNPPAKFKKEKSSHGVCFREGDRVMQTCNNYEILWERGGIEGSGIFNGDIGIIDSINSVDNYMEIRFDDKLVKYDFSDLDDLDLAYAITVHKSQGSEYPVVIMPMYSCAPMLMTRNLLYTAITRARRMVILVGRSDIPRVMVANNREVMRYTTLVARLRSEAGEFE